MSSARSQVGRSVSGRHGFDDPIDGFAYAAEPHGRDAVAACRSWQLQWVDPDELERAPRIPTEIFCEDDLNVLVPCGCPLKPSYTFVLAAFCAPMIRNVGACAVIAKDTRSLPTATLWFH